MTVFYKRLRRLLKRLKAVSRCHSTPSQVQWNTLSLYGMVDVAGSGALQIIIKPHGSAGTSDPLDQRATVGAKVAAYAAKILNELWIIRIEHGVSA